MGGFCGQSIRVRLSLNIEGLSSQKVDVNDFVFICEIRPGNEPRISAQTVVRKAAVMDKVRSKQDKDIGKELFMGEVQSYDQHDKELELEVVFNGRHHSWDYSWKSNRWSEQQHVVDIIVLTYESPLDFRVAGHYTSSQFMILSSHKKSVKGGSTSDKPSTVTLPAGRKPSSKSTPSRDSNGTVVSNSSGSSQGADLADQDLLDASNALSMLAGGCMLPSATAPAAGQSEGKAAGEDDDDEDDDEDEDEDDGDEHKEHPRTFASTSSEMVVLPSRPTVVVKPGPAATSATATATAAAYPSATSLAMAGSVPSTDLLRLQMNNSSTSTRPLALSELHQLTFPSKSATSPSQEPVSSTERRHDTNDGSTKIATEVKPADVVLLPPNHGHNKRKLDADASTDDHHMNSSTVVLTTPTAATTTELNAQDSLILLEPRQKKLKPSSVQ